MIEALNGDLPTALEHIQHQPHEPLNLGETATVDDELTARYVAIIPGA
jgi:hypothetical protein